jgi:hypothetical protein
MATQKVGRDAQSGRFIPLINTRRRPSTTVVETVKTPPRKTPRRAR